MYVHTEKKKKTVFLSTHFVFKCLIPICICYLFEFKYFNYIYKKTQITSSKKRKKKKNPYFHQLFVFVRLNLINHLVDFIPCQICLYFSN